MKRSEMLEIRLSADERETWTRASGGNLSGWVRSTCNAEADSTLPPTVAAPEVPAEKQVAPQVADNGQCARWMHHRPGTYCGTCKKVSP